ncbi:MAG: nicotinate (nicotinamide) nucleotide adenylyltransferase [Chloroflexota bacterium]
MPETIGIFGGTFDPPHIGHLILAAEALNQLRLSRILWVLAPQPPHKPLNSLTPLFHRMEMLKIAIKNISGFELSSVEIDRPGPHYSLDTVDLLQELYPTSKLVLLIGGDSLRDLPLWYRPNELVTAVDAFGIMRRPGDSFKLSELENVLTGLKNKLRFFETPQLEISSSAIRQRISNGGHFRFFLPNGVFEYITSNRLYR